MWGGGYWEVSGRLVGGWWEVGGEMTGYLLEKSSFWEEGRTQLVCYFGFIGEGLQELCL